MCLLTDLIMEQLASKLKKSPSSVHSLKSAGNLEEFWNDDSKHQYELRNTFCTVDFDIMVVFFEL